jgi:hypothetical protein
LNDRLRHEKAVVKTAFPGLYSALSGAGPCASSLVPQQDVFAEKFLRPDVQQVAGVVMQRVMAWPEIIQVLRNEACHQSLPAEDEEQSFDVVTKIPELAVGDQQT